MPIDPVALSATITYDECDLMVEDVADTLQVLSELPISCVDGPVSGTAAGLR